MTLLIERGHLSRLVRSADGAGRSALVPVAVRDVVVGADIVATEPKVVGAQGAVRVVEVPVVRGNAVVVADTVARVAGEVVAKSAERGVVLLEDDCLRLNFANLLGDDLLGHLLEDS